LPGYPSRHSETFPFLASLEVLREWEAAAGHFLAAGGTIMVLGEPDTGKSTLSRYLVYRAFVAGFPVALVDLDLGQSHLGPPTCLGLGLFPPRLPGDDGLFPEGLYFIGQTSPVGATLEVAVGCRVLVDQAARQEASRVVVNTSGFVQGLPALRLKKAQAELLSPSLLLALQFDGELEPLLQGLGGHPGEGEGLSPWRILRLPVSSRVQRRSPEERRRYREERFRQYFQGAGRLTLPWATLVWEGLPWGQGEPLNAAALQGLEQDLGGQALYGEVRGRRAVLLVSQAPPGPLPPAGTDWEAVHRLSWESLHLRLVGLLDGAHHTLALGLILPESFHPEALALWTPLPPHKAGAVRFLKAGKMKVSLAGREMI
jgi:polynucleotide 5'-kinase involved in rRNA processing